MTKLPERKPTRLQNYDYSTPGAYFITICTQDRKCILSRIVAVGDGSPVPFDRSPIPFKVASGMIVTSPVPNLTRNGKILDDLIKTIPQKHGNVHVDQYVIMPNHIHLLLSILETSGRGNPSPTAVSVKDVIGWLKYKATKEINAVRNMPGERVFQRSFYDHVIRNRDDYNEIHKYISENPLRWQYECFYSE